MKRRWQRWVRFTSQKERATTLALFRVAVASVMLVTIVSVVTSGAAEALWIDVAYGGARPVTSTFFLLDWLGGAKPSTVWPLSAATCALAVAMALGAGGRWTVLATALVYRSLSTINGGSGGYDNMIGDAVWLLFLSDSTATLSVDCRRKTGSWASDVAVSAWPRRFLVLQLVVIYTATGLQKTSASWTFADGYSALYWFLQDPTWTRFDMGWTGGAYRLTQLATFVVWHFEVTAVAILFIVRYRPKWRVAWAAVGISMHLGIAVLMNMGPFSWISLSYYICLWRPEELERVGVRLRRRYSRWRSPSAATRPAASRVPSRR